MDDARRAMAFKRLKRACPLLAECRWYLTQA